MTWYPLLFYLKGKDMKRTLIAVVATATLTACAAPPQAGYIDPSPTVAVVPADHESTTPAVGPCETKPGAIHPVPADAACGSLQVKKFEGVAK